MSVGYSDKKKDISLTGMTFIVSIKVSSICSWLGVDLDGKHRST